MWSCNRNRIGCCCYRINKPFRPGRTAIPLESGRLVRGDQKSDITSFANSCHIWSNSYFWKRIYGNFFLVPATAIYFIELIANGYHIMQSTGDMVVSSSICIYSCIEWRSCVFYNTISLLCDAPDSRTRTFGSYRKVDFAALANSICSTKPNFWNSDYVYNMWF